MLRVLTIHFWPLYIGAAILVALGNVLEPPPAIVVLMFFVYMGVSLLIIGNYGVEHQDEIPTPSERRRREQKAGG